MQRRVVFVADQVAHWNAGTERQMLLLATNLVSRGWRVPLYLLKQSDAASDGSWPDDVTSIESAKVLSVSTWQRLFRVARQEAKKGAPVAHCFFNDASIVVPPIFRLVGIRTIVSRRDMGFWYTRNIIRVLRFVSRFVARVVANSHAVAEVVCEREGYRKEQVVVIRNGVTISADQVVPRASRDLVIGLVANIRPIKRIDDAVKAFAGVAPEFLSAKMRIVGGGDASELTDLVAKLGISDRVQFIGRVDDAGPEIRQFSIAMLTSESEGLSNSIIEYMLAGLPVICTETGGNVELIKQGETGYLVKVGDVQAMQEHLRDLLGDAELRRRLGEQGREFAVRSFSSDRMVDEHEKLYAKVAA